MDIMAELDYIGGNTAAVADLLSNVDDDTLTDVFETLDPMNQSFIRNIAGVEMIRRGIVLDDGSEAYAVQW
ncbi:hypothetical protein [Bifidobacterium catulorum]|uniref:Uncharacterized protein n=1 Tax=Bifidobacterium catulorum TaxID=1630173 RepID=A0A2U2MRK4_9BIFI|nr:hypothetical protein [Bifidobacterium catulorum]PWG59464.1 hypothetical protein DF200_07635 [Bifidobacterium catulorum]